MCNECNENKIVTCGCKDKLDLKCTYYLGETLVPLLIEDGMDGATIITLINNYLRDLIIDIQPEPTIIVNTGSGVGLYNGLSPEFRHQIKTIVEGEGIIISENGDSIEIRVDPSFVNNNLTTITNVGTGHKVYKGLNGEENEFKSLISTDGILIQPGANTLTFKIDAAWIKSLFTSGVIDICELIEECNVAPVITGDIVYQSGNRVVNKPLVKTDFTSIYYDVDGDDYMFIKITGGDVSGILKRNGQPLMVNDLIPIEDIDYIKYSGPNTDSASTQVVNYVAINSKGQQSN